MSANRVLYWSSGSPSCWRVLAMLEHKGLEYESKLMEVSTKEHKCEELLSINPRGQLPTFKDGEAVVNESSAVVFYLESQYPEKPLLPADAAGKATVFQRCQEGVVTEGIFRGFIRSKAGKEPPLKDEESKIESMKAEMSFWEKNAGKFKYLASDDLTLADIMMGPFFVSLRRFGASFEDYPNLKKYSDMMKDLPLLVKTTPPHWTKDPPKWNFMSLF